MQSIETTIGAGAALLLAAAAGAVDTCGDWDLVAIPTYEGAQVIPTYITPFAPDHALALGTVQGVELLQMSWDGTSWTASETGTLGISPADVRGAVILAADDIWVCGLTVADNHGRPFIAHWDGQSWDADIAAVLDNPFPNGGDPLRNAEGAELAVIAPDDIWVIGYGRNITEPFHAAMYHWDGSSWTPIPDWTPLPGQTVATETLWDVAAPAPNDAWAVGDKNTGAGSSESLYLHWDGSSWTEIAGPDIGPLTSIADNGPDDVWVSCGFGEFGGRLAHWDGTSWTEVQSAPMPGATHIGLGGLATSGNCDVWATGYWAIYDGAGGWEVYESVIEHLGTTSSAACAADCTGDNVVNVEDLITVIAAWGTGESTADVTGDGVVDVNDLGLMITEWGACP